jgi:hypothetical protein
MSFQWLQMRISEENDRRARERAINERLPAALLELHENLARCVADYNQAFGAGSAAIALNADAIRVSAGDRTVEITADALMPGFQIVRGDSRLDIAIGILPGGNLFYRDADKYLSMEELTRRILDRAFFPKLPD